MHVMTLLHTVTQPRGRFAASAMDHGRLVVDPAQVSLKHELQWLIFDAVVSFRLTTSQIRLGLSNP